MTDLADSGLDRTHLGRGIVRSASTVWRSSKEREGKTILSFTWVPRAYPEAQAGFLSPLKLME
jgi:hypothetical protein